uniref:(northern house mosquito) hypothetical protein n=1 Tax=Culex pipiens TaxID=7175 RepID=A0A8D8MFB2_CULPI
MHRYSCPRPVSQSCRPTPFSRSRCSVWSAALALRDSGRLRLTLQQMIDRFALIFTSQLKDLIGHFLVATTVLLWPFDSWQTLRGRSWSILFVNSHTEKAVSTTKSTKDRSVSNRWNRNPSQAQETVPTDDLSPPVLLSPGLSSYSPLSSYARFH